MFNLSLIFPLNCTCLQKYAEPHTVDGIIRLWITPKVQYTMVLLTRYYCTCRSDGLYYNKQHQHLNYRVGGILLSLTIFSWQHFIATLSFHYTPQDTSPWHLQRGTRSAATPALQNETTHNASHCIWLCKMAAELFLLLRLSNGNSDPQWTARSLKSPVKG